MVLRAFLFAPSAASHRRDVEEIRGFLPALSTTQVMDSAYRRSGARQSAMGFAQGVVVGALGNLFASALGHFIDRSGSTPWAWPDAAWAAIGLVAILVIVSMTIGAFRRYRQNTQVEALFLAEFRRRGGRADDDREDPDELLGVGGPSR
ncbi:MAG: hypothetical protein V4510_03390 [bacterium]